MILTVKGVGHTPFARVLGAFMESRGIPAEREEMAALAERSGVDVERFLARVRGEDDDKFMDKLDRMADELRLSEEERCIFAVAFAFERGLSAEVWAKLYWEMVGNLEFLAAQKEKHNGPGSAQRIREVLVPCLEAMIADIE